MLLITAIITVTITLCTRPCSKLRALLLILTHEPHKDNEAQIPLFLYIAKESQRGVKHLA